MALDAWDRYRLTSTLRPPRRHLGSSRQSRRAPASLSFSLNQFRYFPLCPILFLRSFLACLCLPVLGGVPATLRPRTSAASLPPRRNSSKNFRAPSLPGSDSPPPDSCRSRFIHSQPSVSFSFRLPTSPARHSSTVSLSPSFLGSALALSVFLAPRKNLSPFRSFLRSAASPVTAQTFSFPRSASSDPGSAAPPGAALPRPAREFVVLRVAVSLGSSPWDFFRQPRDEGSPASRGDAARMQSRGRRGDPREKQRQTDREMNLRTGELRRTDGKGASSNRELPKYFTS